MDEESTRHPTTASPGSTPPAGRAGGKIYAMPEARQAEIWERLWMRMSSIYGADRWERAYGATMPPAWRHRLGLRTLAELAHGVALAERDDSGRLPTLGIFATMCRQYPHGQRTPQEPARQQLGDLRSMAERTAVGRAWAAYWQLDGLVPRTMSEEEIEERLENADLDAMRAQVARERQRNPYGGSPHG